MTPTGLATVLLAGVLALAVGGCGTLKIIIGERTAPEVLESSLIVGVSTEEDVVRLLGKQPSGKGRSLLPIGAVQRPMDMWAYEYSEAEVDIPMVKDVRSTYLFVYFDQGRYQGYMWFSSLPQ